METITISLEEYNELMDTQLVMYALEAAGVDSWEGYDLAMEIYNENHVE